MKRIRDSKCLDLTETQTDNEASSGFSCAHKNKSLQMKLLSDAKEFAEGFVCYAGSL